MKIGIRSISNAFAKLRLFLKETRAEMRKVVWPQRRYVITATLVVLFIVMLLGAFVMLIDAAFSRFFMYLFKAF